MQWLARGDLCEAALQVLQSSLDHADSPSFLWFQVVEALWRAGIREVLALAARAMASSDYSLKVTAEKFLADRAAEAPEEILRALEQIMQDERNQFHFYIDRYVSLFAVLPVADVARWLDRVGVEGARHIARHLPAPFLDSEGRPQVPELTVYVLQRFEDDERIFSEFCGGVETEAYFVEGGKKRQRDSEVAEQFLNHPLRRVRDWARYRSMAARADAARQRMEEEEKSVR
jgi:hypothetical protein